MDIRSWQDKLDTIFSVWTRLRFADWKGDVHCYTCSWYGHWKACDAGHFIPRGRLLLRYEPDNVRPQCPDCNRLNSGKVKVFEEELREELGDTRVDEIKALRFREAHYDLPWYSEKFIHFTRLVSSLNRL